MSDWKTAIKQVKKQIQDTNKVCINLPSYFNFKDHDAFDFNKALKIFDWSLKNIVVEINFTKCRSANYQTLSLVILYAWKLKSNGCRVDIILDAADKGASQIWRMMGAPGLFSVGFNENQNFRSNEHKPLVAIRNQQDFTAAVDKSSEFSKDFDIEYINTLRYVISELLYNTLEHGLAFFEDEDSWNKRLPSLIQFTWYVKRDELQFIVADVGVGVKRHLSQGYNAIEDDEAALRLAIQPQVSGTFSRTDPYRSGNNAGMGLFLSSNIIRRLHADMHVISGNGILHISPTDITTRHLASHWPGTIALVSIKLERDAKFELHKVMSEFREAATREQIKKLKSEEDNTFYLHMKNYFGAYPEDKVAAIKYKDSTLTSALEKHDKAVIDFDGVLSSPHSFLSALLSSSIKKYGLASYKKIRIINALPEIRETIDFILDDNTSNNSLDI